MWISRWEIIKLYKINNIKFVSKIKLFAEVEGFLKTPINEDEHNGRVFYVGSITDGVYHLEIIIPKLKDLFFEYEKGQFLRIKGYPQSTVPSKRIYFEVNSAENIMLVKGKTMSFLQTINGYRRIPWVFCQFLL